MISIPSQEMTDQINKKNKQKISKDRDDLNIINHLHLTDIYRTIHTATEE